MLVSVSQRDNSSQQESTRNPKGKKMKTKILLFSSFLFLAIACSTHATLINGTYTAVVTAVTAPPGFSVSVGDTFTDQFYYNSDLLLPPDASGNREVPVTDTYAYFGAWFTGGNRSEGELDYFLIGPNGVPVGAHCENAFGIVADLSGTTLVIGPITYDQGAMIHASITSFSGVPDASSSIGLMGLALSGLAAFRSFTRHRVAR